MGASVLRVTTRRARRARQHLHRSPKPLLQPPSPRPLARNGRPVLNGLSVRAANQPLLPNSLPARQNVPSGVRDPNVAHDRKPMSVRIAATGVAVVNVKTVTMSSASATRLRPF